MVKLKNAIDYWDMYAPNIPKQLLDWVQSGRENPELWPYHELECVNWLVDATALLTGQDRKSLMDNPIHQIEALFLTVVGSLMPSQNDFTEDEFTDIPYTVEIDGDTYEAHRAATATETIGALLESLETERVVGQLKKNQAHVLPKLCAIYLRKEGEEYSDIDTERRAEYFLQKLNYRDAARLLFFLQRTPQSYKGLTVTFSEERPAWVDQSEPSEVVTLQPSQSSSGFTAP